MRRARGGCEAGRAAAGTWADYLSYDAEHAPFAPAELREFVRGLVEAGPRAAAIERRR